MHLKSIDAFPTGVWKLISISINISYCDYCLLSSFSMPGTVLGAADRRDLVLGAAELRVSWENQMLMKQKRRRFTNCDEHDEGKGMAS